MLLADLGADVIKVEQPGTGDPFRAFKGGLYSPHFQTYNRNKRSITLDTKQAGRPRRARRAGRATPTSTSRTSAPASPSKLGVGDERLRALNPRLIYCAITGFGADRPGGDRPSYDTVAQAASGFLRLLVNPANPRVVGPAIADAVTGFYAAYGVLGALYERSRTGNGRTVEVSMLEAMAHFNLDAFTHYFSAGEVMGPYSRPSVSQSYVLRVRRRQVDRAAHVVAARSSGRGWPTAIERPDLFDDPRFATREARIDHQEALIEVLGERSSRTRPRDEWCAGCEREDVPHAPMYDTERGAATIRRRSTCSCCVEAEHPAMGAVPHRALAGLVRRRAGARRAAAADARRAQRAMPRSARRAARR